MKSPIKFLFGLIGIFLLQAFIAGQPTKYDYYELKNQEQFTFMQFDGSPEAFKVNWHAGRYQRGSKDLADFEIKIDTRGSILVKERIGCPKAHQSELELFHCYGEVSRDEDTLIIKTKTPYQSIYLVQIEVDGLTERFAPDLKLKLVSKTMNNEYCPNLLSYIGSDFRMVALPRGIVKDEIYKAKHEDKTIGIFSYFSITDANGKTKTYPQGDYVLLGGNSIAVKD